MTEPEYTRDDLAAVVAAAVEAASTRRPRDLTRRAYRARKMTAETRAGYEDLRAEIQQRLTDEQSV